MVTIAKAQSLFGRIRGILAGCCLRYDVIAETGRRETGWAMNSDTGCEFLAMVANEMEFGCELRI